MRKYSTFILTLQIFLTFEENFPIAAYNFYKSYKFYKSYRRVRPATHQPCGGASLATKKTGGYP